jgi:hypothetical protein
MAMQTGRIEPSIVFGCGRPPPRRGLARRPFRGLLQVARHKPGFRSLVLTLFAPVSRTWCFTGDARALPDVATG